MKNICLGIKLYSNLLINCLKKINNENIFFIDIENTDLNKYLEMNNINYLIPLSYEDNFYLENYIFNKNINTKILSPSKNVIKLLNNKINFGLYCSKNLLLDYIPAIIEIKKDNLIKKKKIEKSYPYIIKPKQGSAGENMQIINNYLEYIIYKNNFEEYIMQEYIKSCYEYTGHFICENGVIIAKLVFKKKYDNDVYIQKSIMDNFEIIQINLEQIEFVLKKLNYNGICNVDFKILNDKIYILEINPRIGGSLVTSDNLITLLTQL